MFELPRPAALASYRLRITANHGDPTVQLAELELLQVRGQNAPGAAAQHPAVPDADALFCRLMKRFGCGVALPGSARRTPWSLCTLAALAILLRRKRH